MFFSLAKKKNVLVYREAARTRLIQRGEAGAFDYSVAASRDGVRFTPVPSPLGLFAAKKQKVAFEEAMHFRVSHFDRETLVAFVQPGEGLVVADVRKETEWRVKAQFKSLKHPTVFFEGEGGGRATSFYALSGNGRQHLNLFRVKARFAGIKEIESVLAARSGMEYGPLEPLATFSFDEGIGVLYSAMNGWGFPAVHAALLDAEQPEKVLWRSPEPLWEAPLSVPPTPPELIGCVLKGKQFFLYLAQVDGRIEVVPLPEIRRTSFAKLPRRQTGKRHPLSPELVRFEGNPVLEPIPGSVWESFAVFNPAALHIDGEVHLLYRAQGEEGISVLGYASSRDGIHVDTRSPHPVFVPTPGFDARHPQAHRFPYPYVSGGGFGGCEDPRLILIEDTVYLIYVAFDGARPPGVALSSISKRDFLAKRWTWKLPKLISEPGKIQKNWVLFSEKIGGRFAILHGLTRRILIEYVDSLDDLGDGKYITSLESHGGGGYRHPERRAQWDNIIRGVGAPPLKTKYGWLCFYHAMDFRDPGKYKVGAMLLDLEHPEMVVARAKRPVLEPEMPYENNGHKRGVVYVCGAIEKDGLLFVYYGASDRTAAVAAADLDTFLEDLMAERQPALRQVPKIRH